MAVSHTASLASVHHHSLMYIFTHILTIDRQEAGDGDLRAWLHASSRASGRNREMAKVRGEPNVLSCFDRFCRPYIWDEELAGFSQCHNPTQCHKQRRFNTKTCYTQNKYNLIREDSEGYAKLISSLNHSGEGALTDETVPLMFQEIQVRMKKYEIFFQRK